MPTYKGNVGNLMQHWTLCELLNIAQQQSVRDLNFIDAHAMAPLAQTRNGNDGRFDCVRDNLPGQMSFYENAWQYLAPKTGYPNSAALVDRVWEDDFSMLLCEKRLVTFRALRDWCSVVQRQRNCCGVEPFHDDWRYTFRQWLEDPGQMQLLPGSLTLVSFDPYKYDICRGNFSEGSGDLYPQDIELVHNLLGQLCGQFLVQLSTYNTQQGDPQANVIAQVSGILEDFEKAAVVRVPDRPMMSLVYARGLDDWADQLENLPDRFTDWLRRV